MDWKDAKRQLLKNKNLKKEYEKVDIKYEIGRMIIDARIAKKMTQKTLASLVGTKQPSIARLEKGAYLPSLSFLQKIAIAFNTQLLPPRLEFLEDQEHISYNLTIKVIFSELPIYKSAHNLRWNSRSGSYARNNILDLDFKEETSYVTS